MQLEVYSKALTLMMKEMLGWESALTQAAYVNACSGGIARASVAFLPAR